ncbi:antitoxin Xre/MbcA/ParS toxin-binding domain-containing protein [Sphingomonas solaris]|uniref:DUF2384 domain-containing protein n=1 Tax=Alterirhizorhabdus solaris TaxID=2529389 RepID=A0A558QS47_9SPHN|nr:antitoxin Xre/MbcA/ParS toxin-binding domain-containing protein [Sphingomonas solaris]TVV69970.1 DUF2384 domain-containing protein [Sphingomonas solaris]
MNRPFAKRFNAPRLSPPEAARQGSATNAALKALGATEAVRFLNAHHDGLGGRPIDLAVASAEGLLAVETHLSSLPRE